MALGSKIPVGAGVVSRFCLAKQALRAGDEEPELVASLVSALRLMARMGIREVQVPAVGLAEIARETGLTAYDAAYLWLVRETSGQLVSLDGRLLGAAEKV